MSLFFLRRCSTALSMSPPHSPRAALQSIIGALVMFRSFMTSAAEIAIAVSSGSRGATGYALNSKFEYRNPKQIRNPNVRKPLFVSGFLVRISDLFRISVFEFRISTLQLDGGGAVWVHTPAGCGWG